MIRQQQPGGSTMMNSAQAPGVKKPIVPGSGKPAGKLMRLRCRLRPLHDVCLSTDSVSDKGCDVVFICTGGEEVRGHKIILSMASKFFVQLFRDQKPHKLSYVSVPDVPASVMNLIVLLCYKDRINVTDKALKEIQVYLHMFGLPLSLFNKSETHADAASSSRKSAPANIPAGNRIVVATATPRPSLQIPSGQIIKAPGGIKQTMVLEPKSNGMDDSSSSDYSMKQGQPAKPRPILPKPSVGSGQVVYRAASGPPILKRMSSSGSTPSGTGAQDPSIEMDVGDTDDTEPQDTPEAKKLMQEWMASLGKTSSAPPKLSRHTSPLKRKASPVQGSPRILKGGADKSSRRQCSVCSNVFEDESKWKWHEDRHVGLNLFKCTICDQILQTARKVYQHEMMEHGLVGTGSDDQTSTSSTASTPTAQQQQQQATTSNKVNQNAQMIGHITPGDAEGDDEYEDDDEDDPTESRVAVVKTQYGTHYRRLPSKKKATLPVRKMKTPALLKLHKNFAHKNPKIGIGHVEGQETVESKKLKQLHWLYVCTKCEYCADSSTKAVNHYRDCYKNAEKPFEDSVLKFRQGFYGKVKCPLCPRRYTSLGGFLIHCGHMHNGYRKKFSHINTEDKMMCVHCRERYDTPENFHSHLNTHQFCDAPPKDGLEEEEEEEDMGPDGVQATEPTANQTFEESRQKQYAKLLGTNPRSARLQNRLAAVTACYEEETVDEESLPPVTCPICGTANIKNLTAHLTRQHPEIDVKVERFEESTLRCKACSITFATCDLLAHNNSCTGSKGLNYVAQRKAASTKPHEPPKPRPKPTLEFPEGIGTSSIDAMDEGRDLMSTEVLRQAFICQVCKRVGKKMNVIADCLRSHGIYRCAVCFNTYNTKEGNSAHLKQCHGGHGGKLVCPICNIPRANAGQLVSHMYNTHWVPIMPKLDTITSASKGDPKPEGEEEVEEEGKDDTMNSSMETSGEESTKAQDEANSLDEFPELTLTELLKTSDPIDKLKNEKAATTTEVKDVAEKEEQEKEEKMDIGDDDEKTVEDEEKHEPVDKNESEIQSDEQAA